MSSCARFGGATGATLFLACTFTQFSLVYTDSPGFVRKNFLFGPLVMSQTIPLTLLLTLYNLLVESWCSQCFSFLATNRVFGDEFPLCFFLVGKDFDLTDRGSILNHNFINNIYQSPIRQEFGDSIKSLYIIVREVTVLTIQ